MSSAFITPNWPAPNHIKAFSTTRDLDALGSSTEKYKSFNLAQHVGDQTGHVEQNRELLAKRLLLPTTPTWLNQVHGTQLIALNNIQKPGTAPEADGSYTPNSNQICVVMSADCLPILLTDTQGSQVAALHAGWRSLAAGIIEALLAKWPTPRDRVMAWLGPAIGANSFEVGSEVYQAFAHQDNAATSAFKSIGHKKWLADLYLLATQRLKNSGISHIYGGEYCTFRDRSRFFSYRRDGQTGRMASLIWKSTR